MDTSRKRQLFGTSGPVRAREAQRWIAATDKEATIRGYCLDFDIYPTNGHPHYVGGCGVCGGGRLAVAACRHRGTYLVSAFKTEPEPNLFTI